MAPTRKSKSVNKQYLSIYEVSPDKSAGNSRKSKPMVDVADLRQKHQTMETIEKELELLQRQTAASEQAALNAKQRQGSGGVWGWLAGNAPEYTAINEGA